MHCTVCVCACIWAILLFLLNDLKHTVMRQKLMLCDEKKERKYNRSNAINSIYSLRRLTHIHTSDAISHTYLSITLPLTKHIHTQAHFQRSLTSHGKSLSQILHRLYSLSNPNLLSTLRCHCSRVRAVDLCIIMFGVWSEFFLLIAPLAPFNSFNALSIVICMNIIPVMNIQGILMTFEYAWSRNIYCTLRAWCEKDS